MGFPLGGIVKVLGRVIPFLGKLGKGKATVIGAIAAVTGLGAKHFVGDVLTAENLVETIRAVADVVTALGAVIAAFGFGRKTGYAVQGEEGKV